MAPANEVTSTSFFCLLKRTQSETKKNDGQSSRWNG